MDVFSAANTKPAPTHQSQSPVRALYKDAKVFITGGTGFMGKILIEKLLRSTDVSTIYLLVREKKGKDIHTRIDEIFDDVIFERLAKELPKFKHKIVAVAGDCSAAGLGLTIKDRQTLIANAEVVFHAAATVNFDEKLKVAYSINVRGTEAVLDLCKLMENLKALVHVSTAYSNCHLGEIDEIFYDYPVGYRDVEVLLEKLDDATVAKCTKRCLGQWPNTYTFTKALAEAVIRDKGTGLPMGIFRPAIVTSTYREPIEGWIDNLYGPTGACAGVASGLLRTMLCDNEVVANIVPVDSCVCALIAAAWDVASRKCERIPENIPIYNYVSSVENPITWGEYNLINGLYGHTYPLSKPLWCLKFNVTSSEKVNGVRKAVYHYLPAVLLDVLGLFLGRKPRLLRLYRKVHKFSDVISYFCTREWSFSNGNVRNLWKKMTRQDRELFPLSLGNVHWLAYFKKYILGIRLHLLKDPVDTIPEARARQKRFEMLHDILKYTIGFISANMIWSCLYRTTNWMWRNKAII